MSNKDTAMSDGEKPLRTAIWETIHPAVKNSGYDLSLDCLKNLEQLFDAHLQAADIKARIDTLQWCAEQENDELDAQLDEYEERLKAQLKPPKEQN